MTEASEKQPVKKRLNLIYSTEGTAMYAVGGDDANCDSITRLPDGSYDVVKGSAIINIPSGRVSHYYQEPRPGYVEEQRNAGRELPSFAEELADGMWLCKDCNHQAKSLHALKVHHGKQHQD